MGLDEPSTVPGFKVQFDLEGFSLKNLWCYLHVGDPQTLQSHHDMTMACSDPSRDHVYSWVRCCQQSWIPGSRTRARNIAVSMIHLWPGRAKVLLQLAPTFLNLHLEKKTITTPPTLHSQGACSTWPVHAKQARAQHTGLTRLWDYRLVFSGVPLNVTIMPFVDVG